MANPGDSALNESQRHRLIVTCQDVEVADEARALAERIVAGRFFVACVGQFKRGKSTVLNALVNDRVLPTGVTPVTSVVTMLRFALREQRQSALRAVLAKRSPSSRCRSMSPRSTTTRT